MHKIVVPLSEGTSRLLALGGQYNARRVIEHRLSPRYVGGLRRPRAEPGVDEDRAPRGADEVGAEVEAHLVLTGELRFVRLPVLLGNGREEVAEVELEHPVGQRQDLDVADANDVALRHVVPPARAACGPLGRRTLALRTAIVAEMRRRRQIPSVADAEPSRALGALALRLWGDRLAGAEARRRQRRRHRSG